MLDNIITVLMYHEDDGIEATLQQMITGILVTGNCASYINFEMMDNWYEKGGKINGDCSKR